MPIKSNAQQSEPQREDLNVHANLSAIHHAQCSFTVWTRAASISRQSALIAGHNAFKHSGKAMESCIYIYQPSSDSWVEAGPGELPTKQWGSGCIALPSGELLVVGGDYGATRQVIEIASNSVNFRLVCLQLLW